MLGRALVLVFGCEVNGDSFSLHVKTPILLPKDDLLKALQMVNEPNFFSTEQVMAMVKSLPRGRLSKYQPLLPPDLEAMFIAERLFDIDGTRNWLEGVLLSVP